MSPEQNKNSVGIPQLLLGYTIGFFAWLAGFHCMEIDPNGIAHLSTKRFAKHLLKVFLWVLGITLLYEIIGMCCGCLKPPSVLEEAGFFLVELLLIWAVLFAVLRFVKNGAFLWVLPGFRKFSCPQCYQTQAFRFQPVSFQFGFWVTYLCPNCACLVNGAGEQIVYPIKVSLNKFMPGLLKSVPGVLVAIVLGILPGWVLGHFLLNK